MTHSKQFKNESQDARRHDKQHAAHPNMDLNKRREKTDLTHGKKK